MASDKAARGVRRASERQGETHREIDLLKQARGSRGIQLATNGVRERDVAASSLLLAEVIGPKDGGSIDGAIGNRESKKVSKAAEDKPEVETKLELEHEPAIEVEYGTKEMMRKRRRMEEGGEEGEGEGEGEEGEKGKGDEVKEEGREEGRAKGEGEEAGKLEATSASLAVNPTDSLDMLKFAVEVDRTEEGSERDESWGLNGNLTEDLTSAASAVSPIEGSRTAGVNTVEGGAETLQESQDEEEDKGWAGVGILESTQKSSESFPATAAPVKDSIETLVQEEKDPEKSQDLKWDKDRAFADKFLETNQSTNFANKSLDPAALAPEKSASGGGDNTKSESLNGEKCESDEDCDNALMKCVDKKCTCSEPLCQDDECSALSSCEKCVKGPVAGPGSVSTNSLSHCVWKNNACSSSASPLSKDVLCQGLPLVHVSESDTPPSLWYAAGFPLVILVVCGGFLLCASKLVRKCCGGKSSNAAEPLYTSVDTTGAGSDPSGSENWGWDGDDDADVEMPSVKTTTAPAPAPVASASYGHHTSGLGGGFTQESSSSSSNQNQSAKKGMVLGGDGNTSKLMRGARKGRGAGSQQERGHKSASGGRGENTFGILADDDLFAELGIKAKPTFREKNPPLAPAGNRSLALQASDEIGNNTSWGDDDLDQLLK